MIRATADEHGRRGADVAREVEWPNLQHPGSQFSGGPDTELLLGDIVEGNGLAGVDPKDGLFAVFQSILLARSKCQLVVDRSLEHVRKSKIRDPLRLRPFHMTDDRDDD